MHRSHIVIENERFLKRDYSIRVVVVCDEGIRHDLSHMRVHSCLG